MSRLQTALHETRSECIFRYVRRLTRETRLSIEDYSEDVLKIWLERTPADARHGDFRDSGSIFERMQANGKKLRRWMKHDGTGRPAVDVEEALVLALPEPYRGACMRDLAERYGGLFVALQEGAAGAVLHAGALVQQCGEALTALAPLFSNDGEINARDTEADMLHARKELLDVGAQVHRLIAEIDSALEQKRAELGERNA